MAPCFRVLTYVERIGKQNARENKIEESVIMFIPSVSYSWLFLCEVVTAPMFFCIYLYLSLYSVQKVVIIFALPAI